MSLTVDQDIAAPAACRPSRDVRLHLDILGEFGHHVTSRWSILDFGCGDGNMVAEYRAAGYQAVGADVVLPPQHDGWLHAIDPLDYRLPFDDQVFDFVFSNSVLEHVQ